ncbi:uncharacterized protein LOC130046566 isoform X1 [Ostrea edulis]|uniref:uncharacterized protein LOC130046566 isoform X1 n=1 Tax=Ostrea edulis TaxID=37623 RepID=UPI0024AE9267|nr:uncharacterized protein LOC130046566 isoform X1 [Ostrea edulis]
MMFIASYVFLFCLHFVHSKAGLGVGVCARDPLRCCPNYRRDGTFCNPCDVGTYGHNCSGGWCVYGSYGFGCLKKCNCSRDQFCDVITGCSYNNTAEEEEESKDQGIIHKILPVLLAVIFSVGSILVIIVVLYNERLKFFRQYFSEWRTRRVSNNSAIHNSDEPQEDYSQMTRSSNSYNVLSFDRHNAISTFNATEEEDIYDEGGAVVVNRNDDFQDSYVTLALQRNQRMIAVEFEKSSNTYAMKAADDKDGDSYVTLAVNENEATGHNSNGTSNSLLTTPQTESSDTYDDTLPNFHSHYYMLKKEERNKNTQDKIVAVDVFAGRRC